MINRNYTFDTFLEDRSNRFALAACRAAAGHPGEGCNPIWLYGPGGCGKTHLLRAVCHAAGRRHIGARVVYITAQELAERVIATLHGHRDALCDVEQAAVLAVDNGEYLSGKSAMQEELARLLLKKTARGEQVILATGRPPKRLAAAERLLRERADRLLLADIQRPRRALKLAFARRLLREHPFILSDKALRYAARRSQTLRQIEGVMQTAHLWSGRYGTPVRVKWIRRHIKHFKR